MSIIANDFDNDNVFSKYNLPKTSGNDDLLLTGVNLHIREALFEMFGDTFIYRFILTQALYTVVLYDRKSGC